MVLVDEILGDSSFGREGAPVKIPHRPCVKLAITDVHIAALGMTGLPVESELIYQEPVCETVNVYYIRIVVYVEGRLNCFKGLLGSFYCVGRMVCVVKVRVLYVNRELARGLVPGTALC